MYQPTHQPNNQQMYQSNGYQTLTQPRQRLDEKYSYQNSIIDLSDSDFFVGQGKNGQLLFNNLGGLSMTFFYSPDCKKCPEYLSMYRELPKYVDNCKFSVANVKKHNLIRAKAKNTLNPIEYVPLVIMFYEGKPFTQYTGKRTLENLVEFIRNVMMEMKSQLNRQQQGRQVQNSQRKTEEEFDTGIPFNLVCDSDGENCYMTEDQIYSGGDCEDGTCCYLQDKDL